MLKPCADSMAEVLARATRTPWTVADLAVGEAAGGRAGELCGDPHGDTYGVWLRWEGLRFLTLFPRKTGLMVTDLFTRPYADAADVVNKREIKALAEVANMAVNGFLKLLNTAVPHRQPVSAPEAAVDSVQELLRRLDGAGLQTCFIRVEAAKLGVEAFMIVRFDAEMFGRIL